MLVDDEELGPTMRVRPVRHGSVRDLIAHATRERDASAILKLRHQLAIQHKKDVASAAPVVSLIARAVLDHSNTEIADLDRPPRGDA